MLGSFSAIFTHRRARPAACIMAALLALSWPLAVWAGSPREEVNAAIDKLLAARSFVATIVTADGRQLQQLEFVAPGRYRIRSNGTEQIIIGDMLYTGDGGPLQAVPLPQDALQRWRDPARLVEHADGMAVIAVGEDTVAGFPTRKYRIATARPQPGPLTVWIDAGGFPLQILAATDTTGPLTLIRYGRFNDPEIRIQPPK